MAGRGAARRQKWIDQSQSLNIYMAGASGKKLDETYKLAWLRGLKTTYYLRTLGATHAEKSTVTSGQLNAVPSGTRSAASERRRSCRACDRKRDRVSRTQRRTYVLRDRRPRLRGLPVIGIRAVCRATCDCSRSHLDARHNKDEALHLNVLVFVHRSDNRAAEEIVAMLVCEED